MTKQRLEGHFRDALKVHPNIWFMKLQVNPMAHCITVGDFMLLTEHSNIVIECKERKGKAFSFGDWTQRNLMLEFYYAVPRNDAYAILCFWRGRRSKSLYYLLSAVKFDEYIKNSPKKSCNIDDLNAITKPLALEEITSFLTHL